MYCVPSTMGGNGVICRSWCLGRDVNRAESCLPPTGPPLVHRPAAIAPRGCFRRRRRAIGGYTMITRVLVMARTGRQGLRPRRSWDVEPLKRGMMATWSGVSVGRLTLSWPLSRSTAARTTTVGTALRCGRTLEFRPPKAGQGRACIGRRRGCVAAPARSGRGGAGGGAGQSRAPGVARGTAARRIPCT